MNYDVFLSYSRKDLAPVQNLRQKLVSRANLNPFFDMRDLLPGEPWPEALQEALRASSTCAVCIGPSGLGPWQHEEIQNALMRRIEVGDLRVIPVFLPGCGESPSSGVDSLDRLTRVHFRSDDDDAAFEALVAGIRNDLPGDPSKALRPGRTSWEHYDWLFRVDEFQLAYLPLLNKPPTKVVERKAQKLRSPKELPAECLFQKWNDVSVRTHFLRSVSEVGGTSGSPTGGGC